MRTFLLFAGLLCGILGQSQSFSNIEAVEYDPVNQQWLVSNGGNIIAQNGLGELSTFASAAAYYGMEIMGDTLYAINTGFGGNTVKAYDLNTGDELAVISLAGTNFPNGMASNGSDKLWVTDFGEGDILEIDVTDVTNATVTTVASVPTTPNGIVYDEANSRCVYVTWGSNGIFEMTLPAYEINELASPSLSNIDGIDMDAAGNFYVASWNPDRITRFNNDFSTEEIIDTPSIPNPADICYSQELDSLAIPCTGNQNLVIIGFEPVTSVEEVTSQPLAEMKLYPNPARRHRQLEVNSRFQGMMELVLVDIDGREVWIESDVLVNRGVNRYDLSLPRLAAGQYVLKLWWSGAVLQTVNVVMD